MPSAPNLGRYGIEGPFNDQVKALKASGDPDWLYKWVSNAPKIKPGIIMPVWLDKDGGPLDERRLTGFAFRLRRDPPRTGRADRARRVEQGVDREREPVPSQH